MNKRERLCYRRVKINENMCLKEELSLDDFSRITEDKIKEAYEKGEFDNLPGFGKPLPPDPLERIPEHLRMTYKVLQNAGYQPEDLNWRNEMKAMEEAIKKAVNPLEKEKLEKALEQKRLQSNQLLAKKRVQTNSSVFKQYRRKIEDKLFD